MALSRAMTTSLLVLLAGTIMVTQATFNQITVRDDGVIFRVRRFIDDRQHLYRLVVRNSGDTSSFFILSNGLTTFFKAGSESYNVEYDGETGNILDLTSNTNGARALLADDLDQDVFGLEEEHLNEGFPSEGIVHRRLQYACDDCEEAWDVVCDTTLPIICQLVGNGVLGTVGAQTVDVTCTKFGDLCDSLSAAEACDGSCVEGVMPTPAPATVPAPTPGTTPAPGITVTPPTPGPTPAPVIVTVPTPDPTPAPVIVTVPTPDPTPAPVIVTVPTSDPTPAPTPAPMLIEDSCDPSPCLNGGDCAVDSGGGHVCDCASGYGGISCQTDTSTLDGFYIEVEYVGTWTSEQQAVFQTAADRWSEVITHVPCGGSTNFPAGRLLITATLISIDGPDGFLGNAGPTGVWQSCPTISATGSMIFDIDDISTLENGGTLDGIVLHEMGHVIGVGTLWGDCSTCRVDGSSEWQCPALIEVYNDLLGNPDGTEADVIETDGGSESACANFDETTFGDELMTSFVSNDMPLSKITAASLEDTGYIVDPSAADDYTLPSFRTTDISADSGLFLADVAVDSTVAVIGDDGEIVEEVDGFIMYF